MTSFLIASSMGAALWAGAGILAGSLLQNEINTFIQSMNAHGATVLFALAVCLAAWLGWKLWQKYRFDRLAVIPSLTPAELLVAMASDDPPLLLDLRGQTMIAQAGPIPGATIVTLAGIPTTADQWPRHRLIVTLCACPGDATAVRAARQLTQMGFLSARPLHGGYEAWVKAIETQKNQGQN